jgi:hypothetical protein
MRMQAKYFWGYAIRAQQIRAVYLGLLGLDCGFLVSLRKHLVGLALEGLRQGFPSDRECALSKKS